MAGKTKGVLWITISVIIIPSCFYVLFLWNPKPEWNESSEALIITTEFQRPQHIDSNYIPDVQIWGNGHIVWVEHSPDGTRRVLEDHLSHEQLRALIDRFIENSFLKVLQYPNISKKQCEYFGFDDTLTINLISASRSRQINGSDKYICELANFLITGVGVAGNDYIPMSGKLHVVPIENTDLPLNTENSYQWRDKEFGFDLETFYNQNNYAEISGEELAFAWEIVNNSTEPVVKSNGNLYWIAIVVPEISVFE